MEEQRDCGRLIKQISDAIRKNANNAMRSQNMTIVQMDALMELNRAPEKQRSLKELEQHLHVAQSTTVGIVSRLEQKGLVEGFGSPDDRRIKLVRITPSGIERVMETRRHIEETETWLLSGLTEQERETFLTLLKKVNDSL